MPALKYFAWKGKTMNKLTVAALCALLVFSSACGTKEDGEFAVVTFFIGDVRKNSADIDIGEIIREKDRITTGVQSSCDIKIGNSIIRIKENSKVLFSQLMRQGGVENTALGLDIGKMLCKPKKLMKNENFLVKTPTAVAGVRGTQFTVEADMKKTTRIKVYDGEVKVLRRVPQLEQRIETLMEGAAPVEEKEKVVITEQEVKQIEKRVGEILAKDPSEGVDVAIVKVIEQVKDDVVVSREDVSVFKVEDFKDEREEIIAVDEKPRELIKQIETVLKMEKEKPKPDGRLLITRYEIYLIKSGKVLWEGKVINPPLKKDDRLYIASGDYVFSASIDGPVLWRKNIDNQGRLEIKNDRLIVYSSAGEIKVLDLETGQE
jgi:hypothetical protein